MSNNKFAVAIDGPNGAGKSTVAKGLAKKLGCIYVDTGAMYRAVGLYVKRSGLTSTNVSEIVKLLPNIDVTLKFENGQQSVYLNGEDVSYDIREFDMSQYASNVSKIPEVRTLLLDAQRSLAASRSVVMDGRDIGTVILPNAEVKIFLTADPELRARRRYEELRARGEDVEFEEVFRDLLWRDKNDSTRDIAPLRRADDAVDLDTSTLNIDESIAAAAEIVRSKVSF